MVAGFAGGQTTMLQSAPFGSVGKTKTERNASPFLNTSFPCGHLHAIVGRFQARLSLLKYLHLILSQGLCQENCVGRLGSEKASKAKSCNGCTFGTAAACPTKKTSDYSDAHRNRAAVSHSLLQHILQD